jgi:hypothetical protein
MSIPASFKALSARSILASMVFWGMEVV